MKRKKITQLQITKTHQYAVDGAISADDTCAGIHMRGTVYYLSLVV